MLVFRRCATVATGLVINSPTPKLRAGSCGNAGSVAARVGRPALDLQTEVMETEKTSRGNPVERFCIQMVGELKSQVDGMCLGKFLVASRHFHVCRLWTFLRKEVIQPQVPLRLPCYDLVPIAEFIFGA